MHFLLMFDDPLRPDYQFIDLLIRLLYLSIKIIVNDKMSRPNSEQIENMQKEAMIASMKK